MEHLTPKHQDLAKKGLDDIRGKLHAPKQTVLDDVKSKPEEFSYARVFRMAQEYTDRSLPTASLIWEYLLGKVVNKLQKFAVMNKLFRVQIATGPWSVAFETATNLFKETTAEFPMEFSSDTGGVGPKTTSEGSLDPFLPWRQLFDAYINLGWIHRLLKRLHSAEEFFKKARELAVCMQDIDKEAFAKIHLAVCLLDRGELKEAMEQYFDPLMVSKSSLNNYTRALYLCYYGSTCRSAADWGRAKQYLREALELAKESGDAGLVSSCCGELGNVFRSEGRYKDAERLHKTHYDLALSRGDIHGLAIACGNIGFLKFYNPVKFDDSLVYQFIEYSLAEQIGDFSRTGIAFNKIGKLYTKLGYNEKAVDLFQIALKQAQKAENIAGEGMAWGNLGTVYRALEQFEDAIACHVKYRDNAERRLDTGGVAIMQRELAMDYYLSGSLSEAESSVLRAFQTLEQIRAQIGEEDESKLSNFEKNQVEAYNLLQVVLVAQKKYKEAFVLADASRGRALSEIAQKRLFGSISPDTGTRHLNEEFITESFENLSAVSRKLSTTLVLYSVVKEFDQSGAALSWVYTWVLQPKGELHFCKTRLHDGIHTKVELNDHFVVSLRSSLGLRSSSDAVSEILRCENAFGVPRERKALLTPQNDEVLESLNGIEEMFSTDWKCDNDNFSFADDSLLDIPAKAKKNTIHVTPAVDSKTDLKKSYNGDPQAPSNLTSTASVEHKGCPHTSVAKHDVQSEAGPITTLKSHQGTGNAISKDEPCSTTRESLPESPPEKSLQEIDSAKCESEDTIISSSQRINDPTGDHQNYQFHGSLPDSPSIKVSGTSYPLASSNGAPRASYPASINAEIDLSSVLSGDAASEISTNPTQSENHANKHVDTENPLSTNGDSVGSYSSAPNTLVKDAPSIDRKEAVRTEAFRSPVTNANYAKPKEDPKDPLLSITNNGVCEDTFLGPISATATGQSMSETSGSSDPELAPWQPMLNQVHRILIEPIADFLPNKDENPRVTFIPQDFLLKVPFAALLGATGRRYVIEDFIISTSPAIHFLDLARAAREKSELNTNAEFSLLAVGNPKMPIPKLPQLPSAQREVDMIRDIVNSEDSEVFVGTRANKKNVVAAMPKHKILHFATHARIDESDSHGDYSMQGLIVLAKSEDGSTCNGLLTAEEVRSMQLNAELVVLSCCDTGLGKVTGDGVLGLSRAFLAAGAACVIVTLWKIDDRSTSQLMTSFYREYKSSRDAALALQRAMKILQAKEETRSPRHWAAFSIVGSTG